MRREVDFVCSFCGTTHRNRVCTKFLESLPVVTGTRGPSGEYVPPEGVSVTVRMLPPGIGYVDELKSYPYGRSSMFKGQRKSAAAKKERAKLGPEHAREKRRLSRARERARKNKGRTKWE